MIILIIAPHADDEVLGCGGVMARHIAQGDQVHVLIATRGDPKLFSPEQMETIRRESREAVQSLGITYIRFLDFLAPKLDAIPGYEVADAIRSVILSISPSMLYLPHRGDIHTDHRVIYNAALVAARPIDGCSVRKILCYETLSETEWAPPFGDDAFIPTAFVDISDYLEHKLRAMACYRSQLRDAPHPRSLRSIEALGHLRGATVGLHAAEAFMVVRDIIR